MSHYATQTHRDVHWVGITADLGAGTVTRMQQQQQRPML